jgi:hypothetical protein
MGPDARNRRQSVSVQRAGRHDQKCSPRCRAPGAGSPDVHIQQEEAAGIEPAYPALQAEPWGVFPQLNAYIR